MPAPLVPCPNGKKRRGDSQCATADSGRTKRAQGVRNPRQPKEANCTSMALASVAAEAFLQVDPGICNLMRGVEIKPRPKGSAEHYATWKPANSVFFTLIKTRTNTVAFCHANGLPYYAAPPARLSEQCPEGTAFLCQWCLDHGNIPRLLVFDMLEDCPDVKARGQHLRNMAKFLPQPLCTVQWAGEADALEGFTSSLPHPVECIVGMGEDPLKLQRYMRIMLPQNMPGAGNFQGFLVH